MTHLTNSEAAIIAAAQASEAIAELLRYAREGDYREGIPFGETPPVEKLAEALALAIGIDSISKHYDAGDRGELAALGNAASLFIAGWVG